MLLGKRNVQSTTAMHNQWERLLLRLNGRKLPLKRYNILAETCTEIKFASLKDFLYTEQNAFHDRMTPFSFLKNGASVFRTINRGSIFFEENIESYDYRKLLLLEVQCRVCFLNCRNIFPTIGRAITHDKRQDSAFTTQKVLARSDEAIMLSNNGATSFM